MSPHSHKFIDHARVLSQRNAMAAAHGIGTDPVAGFTGFADTSGFQRFTVGSGDELRAALAADAGLPGTRKEIVCNWNGPSGFSATRTINGPTASALSAFANPATDIGFDTPPHATRIVAGKGFRPVLAGSSGGSGSDCWSLVGFGFVEVQGIEFSATPRFTRDGTTRPMLAVVAMKNCHFRSSPDGLMRVTHMDDCVFDNAGLSPTAQFRRLWNCEIRNKDKLGDFSTLSGFSQSYMAGWHPHAWYAGITAHSFDEDTEGSNHYDFLQYFAGVNILMEFNLLNNNCPASQGLFGDRSGSGYQVNICAHNNIMTVNSYHAMLGKDPSGRGEQRFYRNTVLRAAGKKIKADTTARIGITSVVDQTPPTTGVYEFRENYCNGIMVSGSMASHAIVEDNRIITNSPGPDYVADVFAGNGSWSNAVNPNGHLTYDDPGKGLSKLEAFRAMRGFFYPRCGYRSEGIGCTDPVTWPKAGVAI